MARYVLIQIDDNEVAGDLVSAINGATGRVFFYKSTPPLEEGDESQFVVVGLEGATALALYAKPTKFCDCPTATDQVVKGAKLGWLVDPRCGKPREGVCQHPRNLLDPPDTTQIDREYYLGVWEPKKPPAYIRTPEQIARANAYFAQDKRARK